MQEHGGAVLSALDRASKSQDIETPKLGGVTRWCQDKFVTMEFIANNINTINAFVEAKQNKKKSTSQSIVKCSKLIARYGVDGIRDSCSSFLKDRKILYVALNKFSDLNGKPTPSRSHILEGGTIIEVGSTYCAPPAQ